MYNNLIVSILIVFVLKNIQNGTKVRAMSPTREQQELTDGVCQEQHWPDLWFKSVKNGTESWMCVNCFLDPDCIHHKPYKKLCLIPQMIACEYGAKFYWFFSLAIRVIDECNRLPQNDVGNTGSRCWTKLAEVLQGGSFTMFEVMRSLAYTHSTIGDETDLGVFYQMMREIRSFLCTVKIPEGDDYVRQIGDFIGSFQIFLTSNCDPEYPRLDMDIMNELQRQFPSENRYDFYVYTMQFYINVISYHLKQMGFHYDINTNQTTFIYP